MAPRRRKLRTRRRTNPTMHPSDWQIFKVYLVLVTSSLLACFGLISYVVRSHKIAEERSRQLADINATDIPYITEPRLTFRNSCLSDSCPDGKNISWNLVVFVKSSSQNARHREIIRRTWARWGYVDGGRFTTLFVVGHNDDPNISELLIEEKKRYVDILHYDGPDDYKNIAFKTLIGMRWATENLPSDYYYASADDDFLVDLAKMQETIDAHRRWMTENGTSHFPIICMFDGRDGAKPFRDKISKWYVTVEEYRPARYPKFCMGGMYVTSVPMARALWNVSQYHRPMRVDDVWITGVLREKLGVPAYHVALLETRVAHHYLGFQAKDDLQTLGSLMKDEWAKLFAESENKTVCVC